MMSKLALCGGRDASLGTWFSRSLFICLLVWIWGTRETVRAASPELADSFADRALLTESSGQIDGDNLGATLETGEPRHGGKPGGSSVWISWLAPSDGVATFWTDGSDFDTLLSGYYFGQPEDSTLDKLKEAARNDDDPTRVPAQTSLIQFGARGGTRYEIAIDGYGGKQGEIRRRWDFMAATSPPPVVVSVPDDRAARQGDAVSLTVDMQATPQLRLQWRLNGNSFGAEGTNLLIASLQPVHVGRYTLRIDLGDVRFETAPVELQINSDGQTNALARDKVRDALASPLVVMTGGDDGAGNGGFGGGAASPSANTSMDSGGGSGGSVSRGYNGTQIFNTTYATPDPDEPLHCGIAGGSSYWYAYDPPADGTLILDTIGSTYDTFLAVYTYDPPFTSYADLIPIICDNDGAGSGGAARLEFAAPRSRQYLVVIEGVNGARGIAQLNYQLDTNRLPIAPTLLQAPALRSVAAGSTVTLRPEVVGSPPLHFAWRKDELALESAVNGDLRLENVLPANSGDYEVIISSHVGAPLTVVMPLRVLVAPRLQWQTAPGNARGFVFFGETGQRYLLEQADDVDGFWEATGESWLGDGSNIVVIPSISAREQYYRLRVE